jgi:putative two-component system hydrogenase maturation factor HypX/HoxX
MSRDMFADRSGFTAARRAFVTKAKPAGTPERLLATRPQPEAGRPQGDRAPAIARPRHTNAGDRRPAVRPAVPVPASA